MICDRYIYSSLAYQGSAGLSLAWIKTINAVHCNLTSASLSMYLQNGCWSVCKEKKSVTETLEIQHKVREVYLKFVDEGELIRIDGDKPINVVEDALYSKVSNLLKSANNN